MTDIFSSTVVHLVGIKGVAMASLAQCLDDLGIRVTGSDLEEDFVTKDVLTQRGFQIFTGFDAGHIPKECDLLVYTGAHQGKQNVEVQEALKRGIRAISHAEALGELMRGKKGISVCGTGGKSTTSAMVAWILDFAGAKPSFSVGVGKVLNFGVSGRYTQIHSEETDEISKSGWFVSEADEYAVDPTDDHRPRFVYQNPAIILCTNISYDHPDIYPTFDGMKKTFEDFFRGNGASVADRNIVVNGDSDAAFEIFKKMKAEGHEHPHYYSIGFSDRCDFVIENYVVKEKQAQFTITYKGAPPEQGAENAPREVILPLPGKHNARNAALALLAANLAGVPFPKAIEALREFSSTMRRFEYKGKYQDVACYDDYAHTPEEIKATLEALREWEPGKRIIAAFQPHTYSRTKALFEGFVESLSLADEVILTDIFASAREQADTSITSQMIAEKIKTQAVAIGSLADLARGLPEHMKAGDVVITMGAGDIYKIYDLLQKEK